MRSASLCRDWKYMRDEHLFLFLLPTDIIIFVVNSASNISIQIFILLFSSDKIWNNYLLNFLLVEVDISILYYWLC